MMPPTKQKSVDRHLVDTKTKFGFKLFSEILREDKDENVFVWPISVAIALSMTYNGASEPVKPEAQLT
ncbi:MAG: serpin family protein [Xenococcaceae cyanobacterium]